MNYYYFLILQIIYLLLHQFDHGSTTDPTIEPWTSKFSDSMTGSIMKILI